MGTVELGISVEVQGQNLVVVQGKDYTRYPAALRSLKEYLALAEAYKKAVVVPPPWFGEENWVEYENAVKVLGWDIAPKELWRIFRALKEYGSPVQIALALKAIEERIRELSKMPYRWAAVNMLREGLSPEEVAQRLLNQGHRSEITPLGGLHGAKTLAKRAMENVPEVIINLRDRTVWVRGPVPQEEAIRMAIGILQEAMGQSIPGLPY